MHKRTPIAALLLAAFSVPCFAATPAPVQTIVDSGVPGPTVLVAGISDGSYDAPTIVQRQLSSIKLSKGKIVGTVSTDLPATAAAITTEKPAAVVVLKNTSEAGQSSTLETSQATLFAPVIEAFNTVTDIEISKLTVADLPDGDAVVDAAKAAKANVAVVTESTVKNALSLQSRAMRQVARAVLIENGMISADTPDTLLPRTDGVLNVGIYDGAGSGRSPGPNAFSKIMAAAQNIAYTPVGPTEVRENAIASSLDVLIMPGGSGSGQGKALAAEGRKNVRDFIENGGGYLSTCAGSYLASGNYEWSLKIIPYDVIDRQHWKRGTGNVKVELTEEGKKIFGESADMLTVYYANGPLLGPTADTNLPPADVLAYFRSDMAKNVPGGVMPNTPAIVATELGKGRIICFSPHPEYTASPKYAKDLTFMIERAVRWAAHKDEPTSAE